MNSDREELYRELRSQIGNTPLVVIFVPEGDPRRNTIIAKLESEAKWGGHYDRVYPALFREYEINGRIVPGETRILENSTGNAGISTAAVGRFLGYNDVHLTLPAHTDKARIGAIEEHGGIVHIVPGDYVNAFPEFNKRYLREHRGTVHLNHSRGHRGDNNETTLKSLESIADEAFHQVRDLTPEHPTIDYYVGAVGNGSTVLGPGRKFREHGTKVYGSEPSSSGVLFELLHPEEYERTFGIEYGSMPVHDIYGMSYPGLDFPHLRNSVDIVEDSILVVDEKILRQAFRLFFERSRERGVTYGNQMLAISDLPRYDTNHVLNRILERQGYNPVGRSSHVGFAAALTLAGQVRDSTIMFLCYDQLKRYDAPQQKAA